MSGLGDNLSEFEWMRERVNESKQEVNVSSEVTPGIKKAAYRYSEH